VEIDAMALYSVLLSVSQFSAHDLVLGVQISKVARLHGFMFHREGHSIDIKDFDGRSWLVFLLELLSGKA